MGFSSTILGSDAGAVSSVEEVASTHHPVHNVLCSGCALPQSLCLPGARYVAHVSSDRSLLISSLVSYRWTETDSPAVTFSSFYVGSRVMSLWWCLFASVDGNFCLVIYVRRSKWSTYVRISGGLV